MIDRPNTIVQNDVEKVGTYLIYINICKRMG